MNERIKELLDQATMDALYETQDAVDLLDNPVTKQQRQLQLEKFAELIVRECANHCDLLLDHKISSEWSRGTHDCSKAIKKHFGVEE